MDVLMPQLGETVAEGKIIKWFKSVGDKVAHGENLCEIETDKVTVEVPAISAGVLSTINVPEGTIAPVGAVIAVVSDSGAPAAAAKIPAPASIPAAPPASIPAAPPAPASPSRVTAAVSADVSPVPAAGKRHMDLFREVDTPRGNFGPARMGNGVHATPLARRLAGDAGIDLGGVKGSGPHGRITGKDVEAAAASQPHRAPALDRAETFDEMIGDIHRARPHRVLPVGGMRRTIAARLTRSKSSIPHFYLAAAVGIDRLTRLREEINAGAPKGADGTPAYRLSVNDFMVKALAMALQAVPRANAMWSAEGIVAFDHSDVAVAVSVPDGLYTPVVAAAETKTLSAISREVKGLAARARDKSLQPHEYQGGTTTLSNLGMYGVSEFSAIINPPQATILAIGAAERHAVETAEGGIAFAGRLTATLSCDHRVVDGVLGAELLAAFRAIVENPLRMIA